MTKPPFVSQFRNSLAASLVVGTMLLQPAFVFAEETLRLKPAAQETSVYSSDPGMQNSQSNAQGYGQNYQTPSSDSFRQGSDPNAANRYDPNFNASGAGASGNNNFYGTQGGGLSIGSETPSSTVLQGRLVSIPKGTLLSIHIDQPVSSFGTHLGDPINATLENDVYVNDAVVVPAGSQVLGQVANVGPAGHMGRHGIIDVRFSGVKLPDGKVVAINAHIVTNDQSGVLKGDTYAKDIAKGIGITAGTAATGTVAGTAAGGLIGSAGAGAVFGLGVGALGGLGYAMARKGKEVVIPSGSRMSLVLDSPVSFAN